MLVVALRLGAEAFVDLQADRVDDIGEVDVVFDLIGGELGRRSAGLVQAAARSSRSPGW